MSDTGYDPCPAGAPGVTDIGHDVRIRMTGRRGFDGSAGLIESHPAPDGGRCSGGITFALSVNDDIDRPKWTVESEDPLTLSPSLLCRTCGHHGFIREGRWIPA